MRTLINIRPTQWQRAVFCALAVFISPGASSAAVPPQMAAAFERAPEEQRVIMLVQLAKANHPTEAAELLATHPLQGPFAKNRTLFLEGVILKAKGDLTGAAAKFRTALADDPGLTLVRSELAQTLVMLDENDSAKHHLELLAADAPTEKDAAGIRSFIDQVDARTPYKFNAWVSAAPSTNLNSGSRHSTVYSPIFNADLAIDQANQAKSGFGVAAGGSAAYNKRLGNDFMFVAAGSAQARLYDDKDFNNYSLSQSLEMRHLLPQGYVGLGAVASQTLENDKLGVNYVSFGPRVSISVNTTAKDHLSASSVFEWRNSLATHGTDSTALMVDGAWTHAFNSSLNATLFGGFDRIATKSDLTSYNTVSGGASVYHEFSHGITANLTGSIGKSNFDGFNFVAGKRRKDLKLTGSVELTKRDLNIFGFAPSLRYTYTDNLSNIAIFDFDNHAVDFRFTKDF